MTQSQPALTIVLPMYNEAATIGQLLQRLLDVMDEQLAHLSFELIVVDDGSDECVRQLADERLHLQQHPYNIGNGAAVKTGIRLAQGKYILLMDAHGQHKPADIPRLLEHVDRYDMVVGARMGESETAVHRDIANFIYNSFAS